MTVFIFFVLPSSTNYKLDSYDFGAGGESDSSSSNYSLESQLGIDGGDLSQSGNYKIGPGIFYEQMANVPTYTLSNPSNWYNKLKLTITNTANNGTDATYGIKVTYDSSTKYVQSDNTLGNSIFYQSYSAWGGASGFNIIGLEANKSYTVAIKAKQGKFTESPYGASVSAATVAASLSFDIDVSATDTETSSPYVVAFGTLIVGTVNTAPSKIWIDFETNADYGGEVYVSGQNGGLISSVNSNTITSATGNLASAGVTEGYGIQGNAVTQSSGGPLSFSSPYNGSADNVGIVNSTMRSIISGTSAVTGGRASIHVKAKAGYLTRGATDYSDIITLIATGVF